MIVTAEQVEARTLQIAVIIVTYKTARLTIEALRSLMNERSQPGLNIRAYVVDNDSGDLPVITTAVDNNGWESWVSLIQAPENGGFAYGNNVGIAAAFSERVPDYIYLLNPDAEVRPGAIRILVQFLEQNTAVGIAGSSFEEADGADWPIAFRFPTIFSEIDIGLQTALVTRLLRKWVVARVMTRMAEPVDWICGASMLIRPAVIKTIGGLDEGYFLYFEETDFCRRAKEAGFSTWYVPASRVMHIAGQSTTVTDVRSGLRRLPRYWYESRRRYFVRAFGLRTAMLIDVAAVLAHALGNLKRSVLRRGKGVPFYIRDLIANSVIWRANRIISPVRCGIKAKPARPEDGVQRSGPAPEPEIGADNHSP